MTSYLQPKMEDVFQTVQSSALKRSGKTTLKTHCWIHKRTHSRIEGKALCDFSVKVFLFACVMAAGAGRVCHGAA